MIKQKVQTHNDGVVKIYGIENIAAPGKKPVEGLRHKYTIRYKEKTVGMQRYYTAKQTDVRVDFMINCPKLRNVSTQDIAVLPDGEQYEIVQVQYPEDDAPPTMNLSLESVGMKYECD